MHYDDLYKYVGQMGRMQWIIFAAMFILNMLCMEFVNLIFVGGEMDHWCRIDALSNLSSDQQKYTAIPSDDDVIPRYSGCAMFDVNWTTYDVTELTSWNRTEWIQDGGYNETKTRPCSAWNYDQSIFTSTIVSRFNLVCGREYLIELSMTMHMAGMMIGTVSTGVISDRFGRRVALITALVVKAVGSAIAIFALDYVSFVTGRLVTGVGTAGGFIISMVIVMELAGPNYRTIVGAGMQLAYSLGFMIIPVFAYFLRSDFTLQLATMAPCILVIPFAIWMPESPRWLLVESKYEEGQRAIERFCRMNGTSLPDDFDLTQIEKESGVKSKGCIDLLRSPTMRCRMAIIQFSWFTSALVYCALSIYSIHQSVSGNLYLSTFINGAIELPVNAAAIFIIDWKILGRRWNGCISLVGAGLTSFVCAMSIMYDVKLVAMIMSLLGKAFITFAYSVVYVFGCEIFPTETRNIGVGTSSMFECLGGIVAPSIGGQLQRLWMPLPSIIYGICASISGLLYILLPETLGRPLPDTIEQADEMAAEQKRQRKRKRKTVVTSTITYTVQVSTGADEYLLNQTEKRHSLGDTDCTVNNNCELRRNKRSE